MSYYENKIILSIKNGKNTVAEVIECSAPDGNHYTNHYYSNGWISYTSSFTNKELALKAARSWSNTHE